MGVEFAVVSHSWCAGLVQGQGQGQKLVYGTCKEYDMVLFTAHTLVNPRAAWLGCIIIIIITELHFSLKSY